MLCRLILYKSSYLTFVEDDGGRDPAVSGFFDELSFTKDDSPDVSLKPAIPGIDVEEGCVGADAAVWLAWTVAGPPPWRLPVN